jgi:uncharacterized protein YgiM (DUF1202 family)
MQALKIRSGHSRSRSRIIDIAVFGILFLSAGYGQLQPGEEVVTLIDSFKVRVRSTPEILPDNLLASLFKGTQLPVTGEENGWYRVSLPDGQSGWVHGDYAKLGQARDQLEVVFEVVKVRAQPTTNSDSVARTINGQRVHLLGEEGGWYKVQIPNETEGWIRKDMVVSRPVSKEEPTRTPSPTHSVAQEGAEVITESGIIPAVETEDSESVESLQNRETANSESGPTLPSISTPAGSPAEQSEILTEVGTDWLTITLIAAVLTLIAISFFALFRSRRLQKINQTIEKGRSKKNSLERTLVLEMKEAQKKLDSLDKEAQDRLQSFRDLAGDSNELSSKTSEEMLSSLEELRAVIENQQKRMDLYSELVSLQNQQIDAYKQENESIKKLLELKADS